MSGAKGALEIVKFADGKFVGTQVFTSKTVTIGRVKGQMLRLDDPTVSSEHAVLHFTGKSCLIEDQGSRNGVLCNGQRIESQLLQPDDEVQIGKFTLRFVIHLAEEDKPGSEFGGERTMASGPGPGEATRTEPSMQARPDLLRAPYGDGPTGTVPQMQALDDATGRIEEDDRATEIRQVRAFSPQQKIETVPERPADSPKGGIPGPAVGPGLAQTLPERPALSRGAIPSPVPDEPRAAIPVPVARGPVSGPGAQARGHSPVPAPIPAPPIPAPRGPASQPGRAEARGHSPVPAPIPAPPIPAPRGPASQPGRAEPPTGRGHSPVPGPLPRGPSPGPASRDDRTEVAPLPGRLDAPTGSIPIELGDAPSAVRRAVAAVDTGVSTPSPPGVQDDPFAGPDAFAATYLSPSGENPIYPPPAHDEDDEDDEPFEPPFDLLSEMCAHGEQDPGTAADLVVEVISFFGDRVADVRHLRPGERLTLPAGPDGRLGECRLEQPGLLRVQVGDGVGLAVVRGGEQIDASEVATATDGWLSIEVMPSIGVTLDVLPWQRVHLQFVRRARAVEAPPPDLKPQPSSMISSVLSVMIHIGAFALLAYGAARDAGAMDNGEARFAKVALKDLELEPPPPPPPPPPPAPEPEVKVEEAKTIPKPQPTRTPTPAPKAKPSPTKVAVAPTPTPTPPTPQPPKPSASASKLMNALGGSMPSSSSSASASTVATTNLDAATPSRGSSGGFKVSGVIGKVPGNQLQLAPAGSGSGRVNTKTAAEVSGKVGKVTGTGPSGQVRGLVTRPPQREIQVQGELDRGEIQKVVNAHLREVQACYERKLLKDPTLAGKINFEWVVQPSGSVGVVRVKFSSVRNTEVASCIQGSIQGWKFPQPKGGPVTVIYPFVFGTVGAGL